MINRQKFRQIFWLPVIALAAPLGSQAAAPDAQALNQMPVQTAEVTLRGAHTTWQSLLLGNPGQSLQRGVGGCGNSSPDPGETCDDGNTVSGDGCDATCQVETGADCTAAIAGVDTENIVPNGDFEQGDVIWVEFSSAGFGPISSPLNCGGCNLASVGEGWVWMGGVTAAFTGSVTQSLPIPEEASTLQFDLWEAFCVPQGGAGDFISVTIDGNEVFNSGTCDSSGPAYGQAGTTIDLATAAGGPYNDGGVHELQILGSLDFNEGDPQTGSVIVDQVRINIPLVPPIDPIPSQCLSGVCGDGIASSGELCDDGNTDSGDGCSSACVVEEDAFLCTRAEAALAVLNGSLESGEDMGDPGFEAGFGIWTAVGTPDSPLCSEALCGSNFAEDGDFWLWFGGFAPQVASQTVSQDTVISATGTTLTFDRHLLDCQISDGGVANSTFEVTIDGNVVFTEDCPGEEADYEQVSIDLTTAAGGPYNDDASHTVALTVNWNGADPGDVDDYWVDNVSINYAVSPNRGPNASQCFALDPACDTLEKFEAGIPAGWTVINLGDPGANSWGATDDAVCGSAGNWGSGNVSGGNGEAACIDADAQVVPPGETRLMDAYLCTPEMDLRHGDPELVFNANLQVATNDFSEFLEIVAGTSAPSALTVANTYVPVSLILDHNSNTLASTSPGVYGVDLAGTQVTAGTPLNHEPSAWLCFHYSAARAPIGWFAQVDNVAVRSAFCNDADSDGLLNSVDNCIEFANPLQVDSNGDLIGNVCDADIAGLAGPGLDDCVVNFFDLGQMKNVFFTADPHADLTNNAGTGEPDGAVNFSDLGRMKQLFFAQPGPSAAGCDAN